MSPPWWVQGNQVALAHGGSCWAAEQGCAVATATG